MPVTPPEELAGTLELGEPIITASNATFTAFIGDQKVVYKPVAGEQPLWDFPSGTLAGREIAAYLLSETLRWSVVPATWLTDGPLGPGMVQRWCEPDPKQDAVTLVPADRHLAPDMIPVLQGLDAQDRPVLVVHENSAALRRIAVFDLLANNADRKGHHVLERADGHRYGIDHGLTFHTEDKLRTVLWGWAGEDLSEDEVGGLRRVQAALNSGSSTGGSDTTDNPAGGALRHQLAELISAEEIAALARRCEELLAAPVFPEPRDDLPVIPWPPF